MPPQVHPNRDVSYLDAVLLDKQGLLKTVPAEVYASLDWTDLRVWCHMRAVYGLPTTELVVYLQSIIGGRTAIEIGSGNGALGRALGVPLTDNCCQNRMDVKLLYLLQGQPTIQYPPDVEELDALSAIAKYKPQVILGSWVTQYSDGSRPGNMYGIDEEAILDQVDTYLVFGSLRSHSGDMKVINKRPHRVVQEPWMWSRAQPGDTALFIWER